MSIRNMMIGGAGARAPDAPTIGTATGGDTTASVTFSAPADNGGSAITGFTVTSSPGGVTGTGASSPITVSGLTNGTAYTFTVTATNAIGTGAASAASNSVTPAVVQLYSFTSATFNTPFMGRNGPDLASVRGASTGDVDATGTYFRETGTTGIFFWKVPQTATYRIRAIGARGQRNPSAGYAEQPCGASIQGDVALTIGTDLLFLIGQIGEKNNTGAPSCPGGGGTYVCTGSIASPTPVMIAGGAGGNGGSGTNFNDNGGFAGLTTTTGGFGRNNDGSQNGNPGSGGGGGQSGDGSSGAGGGGGLTGNGGPKPSNGGNPGFSFTNGGMGGASRDSTDFGGFGGGGGNWENSGSGGAGGGYSGGASPSNSGSPSKAGGGGSFATGTNQVLTKGFDSETPGGNTVSGTNNSGRIVITKL
jgi:hypothetical protein